jgi:hypothetical protein
MAAIDIEDHLDLKSLAHPNMWFVKIRPHAEPNTYVNLRVCSSEIGHAKGMLEPRIGQAGSQSQSLEIQPTLPMITRPRPPFGAHSSFAMRSSRPGLRVLHIVVIDAPF